MYLALGAMFAYIYPCISAELATPPFIDRIPTDCMWGIENPICSLLGSCMPVPQALKENGLAAYELAIEDQVLASVAGPLAEACHYGIDISHVHYWNMSDDFMQSRELIYQFDADVDITLYKHIKTAKGIMSREPMLQAIEAIAEVLLEHEEIDFEHAAGIARRVGLKVPRKLRALSRLGRFKGAEPMTLGAMPGPTATQSS